MNTLKIKSLKDKIQAILAFLENQLTKTLKSKCLLKSRRLTCTYLESILQMDFFKVSIGDSLQPVSFISDYILQYMCCLLLVQCNLNDYFT